MGICQTNNSLPLTLQIAHFTPSSFPLIPVFNINTIKICKKSWDILMKMTFKSSVTGLDTASITVFYNEFYKRLYLYDKSHEFERVLSKHVKGGSNIAAKGAIIVRIVKFSLGLNNNNESIKKLRKLGTLHSKMDIRGWQYATFVEILLITIASQLGSHATFDVMSCWVNLFAFILQQMLPTALEGHITSDELNIAVHNPENEQRDIALQSAVDDLHIVCTSHSKKSNLESLKNSSLDEINNEQQHNTTNNTTNPNNNHSINLSSSLTWNQRNTAMPSTISENSLSLNAGSLASVAVMTNKLKSQSSASSLQQTSASGKSRKVSVKKITIAESGTSLSESDIPPPTLAPVIESNLTPGGRNIILNQQTSNQSEGRYLKSKSDGDNKSICIEDC